MRLISLNSCQMGRNGLETAHFRAFGSGYNRALFLGLWPGAATEDVAVHQAQRKQADQAKEDEQ